MSALPLVPLATLATEIKNTMTSEAATVQLANAVDAGIGDVSNDRPEPCRHHSPCRRGKEKCGKANVVRPGARLERVWGGRWRSRRRTLAGWKMNRGIN